VSQGLLARQGWRALTTLSILALIALGFAISLAVSIGEISIPVDTTAKAVANRVFGTTFELSRIHAGIIWDYRLSRALVAASAGAALALSGAILQALLRNPLAEPYVLGISAGASTGAVAVMILGFGYGVLGLSSGAFIGAVIAFLLVGFLATGAGGTGERIILLADPAKVQIAIRLPVEDALSLEPGAAVKLYLNVAPLGTVAVIWVLLFTVAVVAVVPLKRTVTAPALVKLVPVITTLLVPTAPLVGVKLVMVGVSFTLFTVMVKSFTKNSPSWSVLRRRTV
jgi:hypothetical protein